MNRKFLSVCSLLVASVAVMAPASAATWDVAPTGLDSAAGTAAAPWKTLQRAANGVHAGDTVMVENGTYAGFRLRTSGTAGHPITFQSRTTWGAKITSTGPLGDVDNISVQSASYVTLVGFEVATAQRAGIGVRTLYDGTGADTRNDTVFHCYCHDNGLPSGGAHDGIFTGFALNFSALNNVVDHNGEHGIYISNSADNPVVRGNRSSNNRGCGIQLNADLSTGTGDGKEDGLISNWVVEDNVILGNGAAGGSAINLDGDVYGVCRNNLIYNNLATGIAMYQIDGAQASNHNLVVNNTIYDPASNRNALLLGDGANDNIVFNNILYSGKGFEMDAVTGVYHDYNRIGGASSSSALSGTHFDTHESSPAPATLFTNAAAWQLTLRPGSSALDQGVAAYASKLAPAVDITGLPRPQGKGFDLGAYEMPVAAPATAATDPSGHTA